jgi:hypothetical protein
MANFFSNVALNDLRTSSMSNVRWSLASSIFGCPKLFADLRVLRLSLREDLLAGDEQYAHPAAEKAAHAFTRCPMNARVLKSLDLEICATGENIFNSYALAHYSTI